jgi:hypothetical protein
MSGLASEARQGSRDYCRAHRWRICSGTLPRTCSFVTTRCRGRCFCPHRWVQFRAVGSILTFGTDPKNMVHWPPLLLLIDLYTQALLTMGDDEFFGTGVANAPRNPLSLGEVISLSRRLLNIAFVLYWREDQTNPLKGNLRPPNLIGTGSATRLRDVCKPSTPGSEYSLQY